MEGKKDHRQIGKTAKISETLVLMVCLIVAVFNLPLHYLAYRMFYVDPFLKSMNPAFRPIIDYEPFPKTWYWTSTIIVWSIVAFALLFLLVKKVKHKPKLISVSALASLLWIFLLSMPVIETPLTAQPERERLSLKIFCRGLVAF